ncbi:hypothetical protein HNP86_001951 [Methanococcus maripaludis]|uniref:Uncharacterized protein n=1 Tax=Methanococcus maripaludis TaxID=39152 RepID=A0A7J9NVS8_METMI|nr:hypothetical protein [Methanococcus maripaludis]MBA2851792.1 hypothetical protein [Methanococcus maripaludis]
MSKILSNIQNITIIEKETNPNIRNLLWKRALNSAITNVHYNVTTRRAYIRNGNYGKGLVSEEIREPSCVVVPVAHLNVYDCAEDIFIVNDSTMKEEIKVTKVHVLEKDTCTVMSGDKVTKGQTIAYREEPYYQVGSKLDGVVEVIRTVFDERVVITQTFRLADTIGVKMIGYDAQKGTTILGHDRFEIVDKQPDADMKASFEANGIEVLPIPEDFNQISIVGDADSILKRESSGYLANISLGMKHDTYREPEWDSYRHVYAGKVLDKKTGTVHDAIVGIATFVVGEQTPNYELKVPKSTHELIGRANAAPSTDIFSQYFMAAKYPEDINRILGNEIIDCIDWDEVSRHGKMITGQEIAVSFK